MSRTLVHIGVGKTGTTFLQECLFDRHPGLVCIGRPNHHSETYLAVYHALTMQENRHRAIKTIEDYFSQTQRENKTVILSDETLCSAPLSSVVAERLKVAVPDAHILITVRNQLTAIPSFYTNHGRALKGVPAPYNGRHVSFDAWFDNAVRQFENSFLRCIDYERLYEVYAREFGRNNVHVLVFEQMNVDREAFARRISDVLGVSFVITSRLIRQGKKVNVSASGRRMQFQAIRSRFLPSISLTSWMPGGAHLRRVIESFVDAGKPNRIELGASQKAQLQTFYQDGNAKLTNILGVDLGQYGYPV